jgi:hypothetical protein
MPVLKIKQNGQWLTIGGGGNSNTDAMTLDGKPASYFATATDVDQLMIYFNDINNIDYDTYLAFDTTEIVTNKPM